MNEEVYQNCVEWITERQVIAERRDANTQLRIEDGQPVWTGESHLTKVALLQHQTEKRQSL